MNEITLGDQLLEEEREGPPDPFAGAMPKKDIQADAFLKV